MARAKGNETAGGYTLEVALDASGIEDIKPEQAVKVVVQDSKGAMRSETVQFGKDGRSAARIAFEQHPGTVRVMVGPADASDQEITGLQTIAVDVAPRRWAGEASLILPPIKIAPYYWYWWLRWCRTFTINGVLLCADGSPVPGAQVCAYDVDWWWLWSSSQLVGCGTTDANGAFQIKFKWCCGWWPWWWWKSRYWQLDQALLERVQPVLRRAPHFDRLLKPTPQPSLVGFEELLADERSISAAEASEVDPTALAGLRDVLLERLPAAPELAQLRIWPWSPWFPWWDCQPDIIFRATQECADGGIVLQEGFADARWNVPTTLDVTLVAGDNACCIPPLPNCREGECMTVSHVCSHGLPTIGGNLTAPPAPVGYQNPNAVSIYGDRPYGGDVNIFGTAECMAGVDYYEFEWSTTNAGPWSTMPPAAAGDISHSYVQFSPLAFPNPTFSPAVPIGGRHVYETLAHYESTHDPAEWASGNRVWAYNRDWLTRWRTNGNFADGAYYLRLVGWDLVAPDTLGNQRVLPICESDDDNFVVVRVDNRVTEGSGPTDLRGHPCGTGTVHECTDEPEAAILGVVILRADGTQVPVSACGNVAVGEDDDVQIDFVAHDPDGHLGRYTLQATYDVNLANDLLTLGGTLEPSPVAPPWAPSAIQVGPTYAAARSANLPPHGGAAAPVWHGGAIRLTVKATDAFPYTCCYQLELRSHKRTIVNCADNDWGHTNYTEYSFNIVV